MAKTITICGKPLKLSYNLLAGITYEKMTGNNALDLSKFESRELAPIAEMGYCMLLASNDEKDVPSMEEVLRSFDSIESLNGFVEAVASELIAFFAPTKADQPEKEEDAAKNA